MADLNNNDCALCVSELSKHYDGFTLDRVSFSVKKGNITGLIGRNGAGKSTTLKGILNLISAEGEIEYFGQKLLKSEQAIKQRIGYVGGGFGFYKQKKISTIAQTYSSFYPSWSDKSWRKYLISFNLDENKKVCTLSEGMKVKLSIALALSHGADFLIMDEPTSGLDPLSREEFCDLILNLNKSNGVTVLFSTHITSDLMRIADDIVYISKGRVLMQQPLDSVLNKYRLIHFDNENQIKNFSCQLIGLKQVKNGFSALIESSASEEMGEKATLDDIIIHLEAENRND